MQGKGWVVRNPTIYLASVSSPVSFSLAINLDPALLTVLTSTPVAAH